MKFVTVPRSEEVGKLNVLMEANQAPDIIFTYDDPTVHNFVKRGLLTDLGPLIDKYGQDLKKVLGEEVLGYGVFDGRQYAIPAKRVLTAQSTTVIREDWLDELGLPLPQTTEAFYQALKAFKEHRPGNAGDDIVPYGLVDPFHTRPLRYSFWHWDRIAEEDLYAKPEWLMPATKRRTGF